MIRVMTVLATLALGVSACSLPVDGKALGTASVSPVVESSAAPPTPADFTIGINIIEKSCFGDYGCNLRYKIAPNYTGATQPDAAQYTVVYAVSGCEGDKQASFEMKGDKWRTGALDWDYCTSPTGSLTASVIQVLES